MIAVTGSTRIADDSTRGLRPVLVDVVAEVGQRSVRASDQHLGDAVDCIAHCAEELVLSAHLAAVLSRVVVVATDLLRPQVFGVELQHLGALVIRPNDSVRMIHGLPLFITTALDCVTQTRALPT